MTVKQAVQLFESFRERMPRRIGKVTFKPPKAVACIGYVEGIDYRTTHGKKVTLYHHDFVPGSRPLLAVSADGKQLLLLGGRYQFTERGIVDHDAAGREVENAKHGKTVNPRELTIYEALRKKLGREPTPAELKADVLRILEEGSQEMAAKGKLPHQRRKRNSRSNAEEIIRRHYRIAGKMSAADVQEEVADLKRRERLGLLTDRQRLLYDALDLAGTDASGAYKASLLGT
jgi:hypothetical protein